MKHGKPMRHAFSMIMALFVIVIMATISALVISFSGKMVKETTAQYQNEQAILLANSYTEYAVLSVTGNDRSTACLSTINGTLGDATTVNPNNGYRVRVQISYIGTAATIGGCAAVRQLSNTVTTTSTPLTIIIDAYVDYKDLDNPDGPNMTYHKRTVQKI